MAGSSRWAAIGISSCPSLSSDIMADISAFDSEIMRICTSLHLRYSLSELIALDSQQRSYQPGLRLLDVSRRVSPQNFTERLYRYITVFPFIVESKLLPTTKIWSN